MSIEPGRLLTREESREVNAALAIRGETQKSWAEAQSVSYHRVNKMIARTEAVTESYAALLNRLVRSLRQRYARTAA